MRTKILYGLRVVAIVFGVVAALLLVVWVLFLKDRPQITESAASTPTPTAAIPGCVVVAGMSSMVTFNVDDPEPYGQVSVSLFLFQEQVPDDNIIASMFTHTTHQMVVASKKNPKLGLKAVDIIKEEAMAVGDQMRIKDEAGHEFVIFACNTGYNIFTLANYMQQYPSSFTLVQATPTHVPVLPNPTKKPAKHKK